MIVRVWRGTTMRESADAYVRHLEDRVWPQLAWLPGYRGARLLRRQEPQTVEFLVLTMWESHNAITAFAGEDCEAAVIAREAAALLRNHDTRARHYEVVAEHEPGRHTPSPSQSSERP